MKFFWGRRWGRGLHWGREFRIIRRSFQEIKKLIFFSKIFENCGILLRHA